MKNTDDAVYDMAMGFNDDETVVYCRADSEEYNLMMFGSVTNIIDSIVSAMEHDDDFKDVIMRSVDTYYYTQQENLRLN